MMLCEIWYYLNDSKNVKNTHGGVLLLVKLQAMYKWYQIAQRTANRQVINLQVVSEDYTSILINKGLIRILSASQYLMFGALLGGTSSRNVFAS